MSDVKTYPVPNDWASTAWINKDNYQHMYQQSIEQPNEFWASQASEVFNVGDAVDQCIQLGLHNR